MFSFPVAVIAFNRPDHLSVLLERLKEVNPGSIWFVVDGARHEQERYAVDQVKNLIESIDWCPDIHTNFSEYNMGCRKRVTSGLDWFFRTNEAGIILEDDCIPLTSFFSFCEELLCRYRDDDRIATIQGIHRLPMNPDIDNSYYFSSYATPDGWASWRRAWEKYSHSIADAPEVINRKVSARRPRWYWKRMFKLLETECRDSWGYRWMLANWRRNALSIFPRTSLIENIGYGEASTHTRGVSYKLMKPVPLAYPLEHPDEVTADESLDKVLEDSCYSRTLCQRFLWLFRRYFGADL